MFPSVDDTFDEEVDASVNEFLASGPQVPSRRRSRGPGSISASSSGTSSRAKRTSSAPAAARTPRRQRGYTSVPASAAEHAGPDFVNAQQQQPPPPAAAAAAAAAAATEESWYEELQRLAAELNDIPVPEDTVPAERASSAWHSRCERDDQQWSSKSSAFACATLREHAAPCNPCSVCKTQHAPVRCWCCSPAAGSIALCAECDKQRHQHVHLHKRQEFAEGCWRDLPKADPENGYFTIKPGSCTACDNGSFEDAPCKLQKLDFITGDGVIDIKKAAFRCSCGAVVWQQPVDFLRVRAWPASTEPSQLRTIIDMDLLQWYDALKLNMPSLSMAGFLKAAVQFADDSSLLQQHRAINKEAFRRGYREFKGCQMDLRLGVQLLNDLQCPACSSGSACVHIDSNMKLFVWERARELWRTARYKEFFVSDDDVQLTIKAADAARGAGGRAQAAAAASNVCNGIWTAAGDAQQRRQARQAVTGRCVATDARHGLPICASNLIDSGERYAYGFHLLAERLLQPPWSVKQVHMDIMCKWGPWCRRTLDALQQVPSEAVPQALRQRIELLRQQTLSPGNALSDVRKVLSHAHGLLHALSCQVLWQPAWNSACAKTLGEEGEQFFSYLSQYSHTTRNQSIAGSCDQLTEAAVHFARGKVKRQAQHLVQRWQKFKQQLTCAENALQEQLQLLVSTPVAERLVLVQQMRAALQQLAADELSAPRSQAKQLLNKFVGALRVKAAHALSAYANLTVVGFGGQQLAVARVIAAVTDTQVAQLQELTEGLRAAAEDDSDAVAAADAILTQELQPAMKASITHLQNMMEGLCHDIQKQEAKRDAPAAMPKERQRHSKRVKELMVALAKRVDQYNLLVRGWNAAEPAQARSETSLDSLKNQQFCWMNEYSVLEDSPLRAYGVARAMAVVEADNE
eukprot:gene77-biopygen206